MTAAATATATATVTTTVTATVTVTVTTAATMMLTVTLTLMIALHGAPEIRFRIKFGAAGSVSPLIRWARSKDTALSAYSSINGSQPMGTARAGGRRDCEGLLLAHHSGAGRKGAK